MPYQVKDKIKFLSKASKILSESLDYNVTLKNIANLLITNIADFCMIDLLKEDGKMHRVAARVANKKNKKLAQQMFNYPADPRNKKGIYEAAQTAKTILIKQINKGWLDKASRISREHEVVKKLGMNSFIFAPLKSRNRVIGVLTLVSASNNFSYSKEDVGLVEELAVKAGIAVDKANLFSQAQEALKLRDLFISMAAHELRTPITTISGYAQLLYSKLAEANTPESRWIENLTWETLRLTNLVNELLEINRIKTGLFQYAWKECSLREIVKRALSVFRFTYPSRKIIFQDKITDEKDIIIGDYDKLIQVITNLLDNSAKFSSPETEILLELSSKTRSIYLTIKDQGRGIDRKDLHKIFEEFYQGENHSIEGLGVGLFLVKNIVQQHHGTISIFSKENKGTRIRIKLPKVRYPTP